MFKKIAHTKYPPSRNILIWDGKCGFCKFWKTRWEERTAGKIVFKPYQEAAENFPDIPIVEFKMASRLIEKDGKIFSGPDSAYRAIWHAGSKTPHVLYKSNSWFRYASDHTYNHIAKNRNIYFKITKLLFGSNPKNLQPYWLFYLIIVIAIFVLL